MLVSVTLPVAAMTYTGKSNLGRKEFYFGSRFEVTAHHSEEVLAPGTWSKWSWISQEVLASFRCWGSQMCHVGHGSHSQEPECDDC